MKIHSPRVPAAADTEAETPTHKLSSLKASPHAGRVPVFAAVIVHYRDPLAVHELIHSAKHWAAPPSKIIVVDNSSDLGDVECSGVIVIQMGHNAGYGAAANVGVRKAEQHGFEFVMLLTQDCRLEHRCSRDLLERLIETPEAAISAPLLTYRSQPDRIFSNGGSLANDGTPSHEESGSFLMGRVSRGDHYVDWADGACLLVRTLDIMSIGGFDEAYFLYVEEVDLQLRLGMGGRRTLLVETARAAQEPGNYTLYLKHRNLTYFTKKNAGVLDAWPWYRHWPVDSARMIRRGRFSQPLWGLRGYLDGLRGRMGTAPLRLLQW